jgi:hypothetical protein
MREALFVILGHAAVALLLSWIYFRRYPIARPPIGVFNLRDVALMISGIVLVPYLYLALPSWLVAGLLALGMASSLYFMCEPVLRSRVVVWLATLTLALADLGAALAFGPASAPFFAANNLVLSLAVVGLTNLWAQSGMRARDVALLAVMLMVYDFIATWRLPLMTDLFRRLADLPFAPLLAWPAGGRLWLGVGVGDVLLAAVFPLVARKAFGRAAGLAALAIGLGCLVAVAALPALGIVRVTFPVMIVLGPLIALQYIFWRRQSGLERTTWQYVLAEPAPVRR